MHNDKSMYAYMSYILRSFLKVYNFSWVSFKTRLNSKGQVLPIRSYTVDGQLDRIWHNLATQLKCYSKIYKHHVPVITFFNHRISSNHDAGFYPSTVWLKEIQHYSCGKHVNYTHYIKHTVLDTSWKCYSTLQQLKASASYARLKRKSNAFRF